MRGDRRPGDSAGTNLRLVTVLPEFEVSQLGLRGDDQGLKGFGTPRWMSRPERVPRASCTYIAQETAAISGVPAPSVRKPTVRKAGGTVLTPFLRQNPPIFTSRLETLRIILACNPPCAQ
jgi:hypothetical protein